MTSLKVTNEFSNFQQKVPEAETNSIQAIGDRRMKKKHSLVTTSKYNLIEKNYPFLLDSDRFWNPSIDRESIFFSLAYSMFVILQD